MGSLITTMRDLAHEPNIDQARYELRKAVDQGAEADQAAWAREWGESALDRADVASTEYAEDGWWEPGEKVGDLVAALVERSASIHLLLAAETPDISKLRSAFGALRSRINDLSNELEEGDDE